MVLFEDEVFQTETSLEQMKVEDSVRLMLERDLAPTLKIEIHKEFLEKAMDGLSKNFQALDASRPWFIFWISQALDVLGCFEESKWSDRIAHFLNRCLSPSPSTDTTRTLPIGFGGGPNQLAHLAPTYAAVCALCIAGTEEGFNVIDRSAMLSFLIEMKDSKTGGFRMHANGETDMRGTYCAIAVASLLNILTPELIQGVPEYVMSSQTFEGGFAGDRGGLEAHGGYSYCALATLGILSRILGQGFFERKKFDQLLWWLCQRQMSIEGGFNGRANKLVDSCYSFWQGASLVILRDIIFPFCDWPVPNENKYWFKRQGLEDYVLGACQECNGGLRDKPGKSPDYYHTCYSLSGLAVTIEGECDAHGLRKTHCLYNIRPERIEVMKAWLDKQPKIRTAEAGLSGVY